MSENLPKPEAEGSDAESGSNTSVEDETAFVATVAPQACLDADCLVVSCGLVDFEESDYSTGTKRCRI